MIGILSKLNVHMNIGCSSNVLLSCTLAYIRDAMLAKLIRGELRVKDAVKFIKEAHE